jgi:hypothetical protein
MYVQASGFDNQGSTYFKAPNPEFGATFTYYLKEVPKTGKALRQEKEKALFEKGEPIPQPSGDELLREDTEIKPYLIFTITDESNNVVKRLYKAASKGVNRITWNFTYEPVNPVTTEKFEPVSSEVRNGGGGIQAMPGNYKVSMSMYSKGEIREIAPAEQFICKPLNLSTFTVVDQNSKYRWIMEASDFTRSVYGSVSYSNELLKKINAVMQAIQQTPAATPDLMKEASRINTELQDILLKFRGPRAKASWEELPPMDMPLSERLDNMASATYGTSGEISTTAREQLRILHEEFPPLLERIKKAGEDIQALDRKLDAVKAPWTPGRVPVL